MKCNDIREMLSPYLDNMLEKNQMKNVEDHLDVCDSCKKEYTELINIVDLLGQIEEVPIPDTFELRLKRALTEERKEIDNLKSIAKKRTKWRMVSSIAAIFAVGVLSIGMYKDIFNVLPENDSGMEQAGLNAQMDMETYGIMGNENNALNYKKSLAAESNTINESSTEEITINSRISDNNMQEKTIVSESQALLFDSSKDSYNPEKNNDDTGIPNSFLDIEDFTSRQLTKSNVESVNKYQLQIPSQGIERNSAAIEYYNNLIEEKLVDFEYQIINCSYSPTGEWRFDIFIFNGKDGNTYNEEIIIIGRNGAIEVLYANEFMGL